MSSTKETIDKFLTKVFPWSAEDSIEIHAALRLAQARIEALEAERDAALDTIQSAYDEWHMGTRQKAVEILHSALQEENNVNPEEA